METIFDISTSSFFVSSATANRCCPLRVSLPLILSGETDRFDDCGVILIQSVRHSAGDGPIHKISSCRNQQLGSQRAHSLLYFPRTTSKIPGRRNRCSGFWATVNLSSNARINISPLLTTSSTCPFQTPRSLEAPHT